MICNQLQSLGLSRAALLCGSKMDEINVQPECAIHPIDLGFIRAGKEECILHMLSGGNGYPYSGMCTTSFKFGCTQERRDLKRLLEWELDLTLCMRDGGK